MEYYIKRYGLEVVEKDGKIESVHIDHKGEMLEMKLENNKWILKADKFVLMFPNI